MKDIRFCKHEDCPNLFEVYPSSKRQFCSKGCHQAYKTKSFEEKKIKEALTCCVCSKKFYVRPCRVEYGAKYCSYECHQVGEGRKGGAITAKQKRAASKGKSYIKDKGLHAHRSIAEKTIGRRLGRDEIVHHKDGDKFNNNPANLEVMTRADHIKVHRDDLIAGRINKKGKLQ